MARQTKAQKEEKNRHNRLSPKILKIAVRNSEVLDNIYLLDLDRISYITTRNAMEENQALLDEEKKKGKKTKASKKSTSKADNPGELVFVCRDGGEYTSSNSLKDLEEKLEIEEGNVWFMRTSHFVIVNLREISEMRIHNARDLYFRDIEGRIINGVTRTYFDKFRSCPHYLV